MTSQAFKVRVNLARFPRAKEQDGVRSSKAAGVGDRSSRPCGQSVFGAPQSQRSLHADRTKGYGGPKLNDGEGARFIPSRRRTFAEALTGQNGLKGVREQTKAGADVRDKLAFGPAVCKTEWLKGSYVGKVRKMESLCSLQEDLGSEFLRHCSEGIVESPEGKAKEVWEVLRGLGIVTELGDSVIEGKIAVMEARDKAAEEQFVVAWRLCVSASVVVLRAWLWLRLSTILLYSWVTLLGLRCLVFGALTLKLGFFGMRFLDEVEGICTAGDSLVPFVCFCSSVVCAAAPFGRVCSLNNWKSREEFSLFLRSAVLMVEVVRDSGSLFFPSNCQVNVFCLCSRWPFLLQREVERGVGMLVQGP
ncbi:hypothetical protein Ancab_006917 [Ancistrocladus abbreviatus]